MDYGNPTGSSFDHTIKTDLRTRFKLVYGVILDINKYTYWHVLYLWLNIA